MKTARSSLRSSFGFTLVEIIIAATISAIAVAATMSVFISGLKMMYKDNQRLASNTTLRYLLAHISKNSLDSTEFYLFPNYTALDGSVNLSTSDWTVSNLSQPLADSFGSYQAYGDCLVLVTRITLDQNAKIRWIRIYYRATTSPNTQAPILYYERDWGSAGTATTLESLLNAIVLSPTPTTSQRQLVAQAIGRKVTSTGNNYPIFSSETPGTTPSNASVAINVEIINGTTANNMLSSSSLNYIISPRK